MCVYVNVCVCVCEEMCLVFGCGGGGGGGEGEEMVAGYLSILSMSQIETIPKLVTSRITHMIHINSKYNVMLSVLVST